MARRPTGPWRSSAVHTRPSRPRPGWAEQDPEALARGHGGLLGRTPRTGSGLSRVRSVGIVLPGQHARPRRCIARASLPGHHLAGHPRGARGGRRSTLGRRSARRTCGEDRSPSTPRSRCRAWPGWQRHEPAHSTVAALAPVAQGLLRGSTHRRGRDRHHQPRRPRRTRRATTSMTSWISCRALVGSCRRCGPSTPPQVRHVPATPSACRRGVPVAVGDHGCLGQRVRLWRSSVPGRRWRSRAPPRSWPSCPTGVVPTRGVISFAPVLVGVPARGSDAGRRRRARLGGAQVLVAVDRGIPGLGRGRSARPTADRLPAASRGRARSRLEPRCPRRLPGHDHLDRAAASRARGPGGRGVLGPTFTRRVRAGGRPVGG